MKTLYLVRHAQASKEDTSLPDRDRPLNPRGEHDAPLMGQRLARRGARPDLLLTSPARRALTTARLLAEALGLPRHAIIVDERLYEGNAQALLAMVRAVDDRHRTLMLVGHNPDISQLAHRLAPEVSGMSTCAVLECGFDTATWAELGSRHPVRVNFDAPRLLPSLQEGLKEVQ